MTTRRKPSIPAYRGRPSQNSPYDGSINVNDPRWNGETDDMFNMPSPTPGEVRQASNGYSNAGVEDAPDEESALGDLTQVTVGDIPEPYSALPYTDPPTGPAGYANGSELLTNILGSRRQRALEDLTAARDRIMQSLSPQQDARAMYLAMAQGFLSPTRTGGTAESFGNAAGMAAPYRQKMADSEEAWRQEVGKMDYDTSSKSYEQAMKNPTMTEIGAPGGFRQKVAMLDNGQIIPIGEPFQSGGVSVQIGGRENNAGEKKIGEIQATQLGAMYDYSINAGQKDIYNWTMMGELQKHLPNQGPMGDAYNTFAKYAESVGIDPKTMGVDSNTAVADAMSALSKGMALSLRNPANGGGMPGNLSNSDRVFLTQMIPSIETIPEAAQFLANMNLKQTQRRVKLGEIAMDKWDETKNMTAVRKAIKDFNEQNPIFDDNDRKAAQELQRQYAKGNSTLKGGTVLPSTFVPGSSIQSNPN